VPLAPPAADPPEPVPAVVLDAPPAAPLVPPVGPPAVVELDAPPLPVVVAALVEVDPPDPPCPVPVLAGVVGSSAQIAFCDVVRQVARSESQRDSTGLLQMRLHVLMQAERTSDGTVSHSSQQRSQELGGSVQEDLRKSQSVSLHPGGG
jgi:hypothetical protein